MQIIKIINAREVLNTLSEREDIGTHLSYWMTKFVAKTESEYEFYSSEMCKIYKKYAEKEDDNRFFIPAEKISEFNEAVALVDKTDVEDPGIRFSLSELSTELKLSMKQIYPLLDFIDEGK